MHPLSEVRQRLSGILARFRREGAAAEPVAFGSHRKPEAILLPYEVYERYEALSRQRARLDSALASAQSVQAELPGPFSPDHDREVSAEREITHAALILLDESPVSASYDLPHLRDIHQRIFGDIYQWARQIRTVAIAWPARICTAG